MADGADQTVAASTLRRNTVNQSLLHTHTVNIHIGLMLLFVLFVFLYLFGGHHHVPQQHNGVVHLHQFKVGSEAEAL